MGDSFWVLSHIDASSAQRQHIKTLLQVVATEFRYLTFLAILLLFGGLVTLASVWLPMRPEAHVQTEGLGAVLHELLPGPECPPERVAGHSRASRTTFAMVSHGPEPPGHTAHHGEPRAALCSPRLAGRISRITLSAGTYAHGHCPPAYRHPPRAAGTPDCRRRVLKSS